MNTAKELLEAAERGGIIEFFDGKSWLHATGKLRIRVDPYKELKEHVVKGGEIEWYTNTGWIVLNSPPCFDHPVDRYRIYDPYRKLKEAHASGAGMYIRLRHGELISCDPDWSYAPELYCFKY